VTGLCLTVGSGQTFFGRSTRQGVCIHAAAEGFDSLGIRYEAAIRASEVDQRPLSDENVVVDDAAWVLDDAAKVGARIQQYKTQFRGESIALLVLDTLMKHKGDGSVHYPTPANRVLMQVQRISEELRCFVLVINHERARGKPGVMDGHDCLFNGSDTVMWLNSRGELVSMKARDSGRFGVIPWQLRGAYWEDLEGELQKSAYVPTMLPLSLTREQRHFRAEFRRGLRDAQAKIREFRHRHPEVSDEDLRKMCLGQGMTSEAFAIVMYGAAALEPQGRHHAPQAPLLLSQAEYERMLEERESRKALAPPAKE